MKTLLSILLLTVSTSAFASMSGLEIMKNNDQQRKVDDEKSTVLMTLTNKQGQNREREVVITTKTDDTGLQSSIVKFEAPSNVSGTGLLTIENANAEDDQWLYLPALKRSRRISASNQSDSFMGTDFSFEDLSPEDLNDFEYKRLDDETINGEENYKIKATPKNESILKDSGYSYRVLWVRKKDFIVSQIHYFDKNGQHSKTLTALDIQPIDGSGVSRAQLVTMKTHQTNHQTELKYNNFAINQGISQQLFSMRSLERGW
ncbi:outer membrane lipoprotein-sorting protein [Bermanella sp. R86510]|uniref:outer membrane lipoprotein-sorting protein n=1 Tax=unclassified Bermanella TaxID=2627862 RepID=UPI0037C9CBB7